MPYPTVDEIKKHYASRNLRGLFALSVQCHKYVMQETEPSMEFSGYSMRHRIGSNKDGVRPIKMDLFIEDGFAGWSDRVVDYLGTPHPEADDQFCLDQRRLVYTMQQSVGAYLDLVAETQTVRKVAGEFFQGVVGQIFACHYAISSGTIAFDIKSAEGLSDEVKDAIDEFSDDKRLKLSFDQLVRPANHAVKNNMDLTPPCVVCGVKTTTKDRGIMFYVDKFFYQQTHTQRPKFIAVVLNDVQRKRSKGITTGLSYTFLGGHNKLYRYLLGSLDGYYFIDPPPAALREMEDQGSNMKTIDRMINHDLPMWLA